jgi:hypothetical protein
MELTRRELMAGIGGGSLVVGGLSLRRRTPRFTNYTFAAPADDTTDSLLRIAWYETYNGDFVENHAGTSDGYNDTMDPTATPSPVREASDVIEGSGPVLALDDVLPGDRGTLVVGLDVDEQATDPVEIWFRGAVTDDAENGVNEPEYAAGDDTPEAGELDEAAVVELWMDESPIGSCDGLRNYDEALRAPLVARAPFASAFGPSTGVGSEAGVRLFDTCLDPGTLRCVALSWSLPEDASDRVQGDSLAFDFAFAAGPCGGESPFLLGGDQ